MFYAPLLLPRVLFSTGGEKTFRELFLTSSPGDVLRIAWPCPSPAIPSKVLPSALSSAWCPLPSPAGPHSPVDELSGGGGGCSPLL